MGESGMHSADLDAAPIYDEVVRDLGIDPLDPAHSMHDAYNAATLYHEEAQQRLRESTHQ